MRSFPLFSSHLDLAHQYMHRLLNGGDWAIDATCGNGHDTLELTRILHGRGGVIGIDIQQDAIEKTRTLLESQFPKEDLRNVHLFCQSHADFPVLCFQNPIRLVVYNLGYLPGGNKRMTTLTESTLQSVRHSLNIIIPGGAVLITCYPGHAEGAKEEKALHEELSNLSPRHYNICAHTFVNRASSPSLLLIQKNLQF
jgi:SAM-dependent methyltransferase